MKWKGQTCFGLASPLGKNTIVLWKQYVEQMSGGRLAITLHDAGEIVPPTKIYDAIRDGLLDFGLNTPAWQKGKYPAGDLFYTLPGGVLEFNDLIIWLYAGGGKELEQQMYGDEVIVFPLGLTPPEEIWSKKPIRTLADMKGLKIRAAGLSMELWEKLGASVVLLPGGEVLPSLQRGLIDATEFLEPSVDYTLGLHEVCKYRFGPPVHMSNNIFQLMIKPAAWKKLPDDLKAIVEKAAMAATFQGYATFWMDSIEYNKKIEDYGIITTKLSKEEQAKTTKLAFEILEQKSKKDPYFAKVWTSQKAFIEKYKPYYNLTKFD
ncbi:MAG: TRAP transporter substrate-binding protein DctP [Deltaproteobacteria bacterium]|nr:TRAP transporter substrate-binding protein DctP [Deltaproteobacteria bacterium]